MGTAQLIYTLRQFVNRHTKRLEFPRVGVGRGGGSFDDDIETLDALLHACAAPLFIVRHDVILHAVAFLKGKQVPVLVADIAEGDEYLIAVGIGLRPAEALISISPFYKSYGAARFGAARSGRPVLGLLLGGHLDPAYVR